MKTSKTHSKYLKKIAKTINSLLKKPTEKFEKEDYHSLRVEIKKLNAHFDFVKFSTANFKRKKYFKVFKKIFKQSGRIRKLQLEEAALKKFTNYSVEHYLGDLKNRISKEQKKFIIQINKKNRRKIKKVFQKIIPFIHNAHKANVREFMESERNKIREIIQQKKLKPEQLHILRKLLKVDFYNRKMSGFTNRQNAIKEENDFLELLGEWHDCRSINYQLENSVLKEEIDPTELSLLLQINTEISLVAKKLFNEIVVRIETQRL